MGNDKLVSISKRDYGTQRKKKTPLQIETLEEFYTEENNPKPQEMKDYASVLGLTYKQVRSWFADRRRKDRSDNNSSRLRLSSNGIRNDDRRASATTLNNISVGNKAKKKKRKLNFVQDTLPQDYILKKIFRKDGPPLGVEFDSPVLLPDPKSKSLTCPDNQRGPKRRKVLVAKSLISQSVACKRKSARVMKHGMGKGLMKHGMGKGLMQHGMGKGLMTVWRAMNPSGEGVPSGATGREATNTQLNSKLSKSKKPSRQKASTSKKSLHQRLAEKQSRLAIEVQNVRKRVVRRREVRSSKAENLKSTREEECKLVTGESRCEEYHNALESMVDDEELELRELQAGPNPLTCASGLASNGNHSCSLCKDLLPRFPPRSIKMMQPFHVQPWASSTELVKKLFKVFRFLYRHADTVDMVPFTLDEFAQAFHDKDSLVIGEIHVGLLKLLLSDVETELSSGFLSHMSRDSKFIAFLHSVKHQQLLVNLWIRSLNPLTWTEILRQVFIAAGFGSSQALLRKKLLEKEANHMVKYGLCPGTLKGEVFNILSEKGNSGLRVSELAKLLQTVSLSLAETSDELEAQIYSTLSSDITLFEKISPSAYRVRSNFLTGKRSGGPQSDSEESDDHDSMDSGTDTSDSDSDNSELDSAASGLSIVKFKDRQKRKNYELVDNTEIDESHPGEVWVLGLMEGEYSDLSIEEKLDALIALVDLVSSGCSLRMEDPLRITTESVATFQHQGGAKIKRSSAKLQPISKPFQSHFSDLCEIRSAGHGISKPSRNGNSSKGNGGRDGSKTNGRNDGEETGVNGHPLQSIYLGSDRRYNGYWLLLGPCNAKDLGHRRIYFESSEDGHWEVIDTEEALCALLSVLDGRGTRESRLLASLEKREAFLCQAMSTRMTDCNDTIQSSQSDQSGLDVISGEGSSPVSGIDSNRSFTDTSNDSLSSSPATILQHGNTRENLKQRWERLQAYDAWIWKSFYSNFNVVRHNKRSYLDSLARCECCHDLYWRDEKHCKICHTTFELDFDLEERYAIHVATCREKESNTFPNHKVLSSQLQSLKAAVHALEAAMPEGALLSSWIASAHKLWVKRLRRTSSVPEFYQVLIDFVGAINEEWLGQCMKFSSNTVVDEIITSFPSTPQTTSALALWLVKLDTLLAPYLERVHSEKAQEKSTRQKGRSVRS